MYLYIPTYSDVFLLEKFLNLLRTVVAAVTKAAEKKVKRKKQDGPTCAEPTAKEGCRKLNKNVMRANSLYLFGSLRLVYIHHLML